MRKIEKREKYTAEKFKLDFLGSLTAAAWVFPLALAFGANSPFGAAAGLIGAVISSFIGTSNPAKIAAPNQAVFLVLFYAANAIGIPGTMLSCIIAGLFLMFAASIQLNRSFFKMPSVALGGLTFAIALALCITQVNFYFGIGVPQGTAFETISAYRSFGFHANWRGVLFGTITLVTMITFPIKFKKLSKRLPASIVSIVITTLLNVLLLNPNAETSAIDEVGSFSRCLFPEIAELHIFSVNESVLWQSFIYAAALIIIYFTETLLKENRNATIRRSLTFKGLSAVVCPVCDGMIGGETVSYGATRVTGILCSAIVLIFSIAAHDLIVRVPTATLAVIIICTGWQNVRYSAIKKALMDADRIKNLLIIILIVALGIIWNLVYVLVIVSAAALIRCFVIRHKTLKAAERRKEMSGTTNNQD